MRSLLFVGCLLAAGVACGDETENSDETADDGDLRFGELFSRAAVRHVALSPGGDRVAYFREETLVIGSPSAGYFDIRTFHSRLSIEDLDWIGPSTVWVESWDPKNFWHYGTAIEFSETDDEGFELERVYDHTDPGYISDRLPDDGDHIVLARPHLEDDVLSADLFTVNLFEPFDNQLKNANRVDTGSEKFFYYQRNSAGDFTLGIRVVEGVPEIWRRLPAGDTWEHVWTADKESTFVPWRMSEDARTLWVLTDAESDRIVAAEFDLESRSIGETLFAHDRVDVDSILMSQDESIPIGVAYTEQGLLRYHFFSEEHDAEFARLKAQFPGQGVMLIGYADASNVRLVFASSPSERGAIHVCDLANDKCELIEKLAPWLDGKPLSPSVALRVPSTDNFVIDAFLTLPLAGGDSIPMIALPHGGPIGVSDDRYFSAEVQWLAHNGYAVLQVNYRGSSGYGEQFVKAGLRQWGRGIEDDIEAAVQHVLAKYPQIDGDRIGIFGGSYGGYSAIMSVIRNPDLFKCAASFAGVMDLTLLFTQSTNMRNEYTRDVLIKYVGDPEIDYDEQIENSPVYRYKDITRPVLLGHGIDDTVVDFEHSWRLRKMMRLNGTTPEFILQKEVGHGFAYVSDARDFFDPLLAFLDKHLKPVDEQDDGT